MRHPNILLRENAALLVVDVQEKILPAMYEGARVIQNTLKLIHGFKVMNTPIYYTEQYPKGLGPTETRIKNALTGIEPIQKITFSCYGADNLFDEFEKKNISKVVVCGIESHVCVIQTALDLIINEFQVFVAADAVSSRRKYDYESSLRRMERNKIEVTLTESILFEMLNVSGTDEFKAVSKLVK